MPVRHAEQELPNINHRKQYEATLDRLPDYRITCFFVDRRYRRSGVAAVALRGALDLIAQAGGGIVEAYPQDTEGRKSRRPFCTASPAASSSKPASTYDRPKGKNHTVMRTTIDPAR